MASSRPQTPICPLQLACDGDYIRTGRSICVLCEQAIQRRAREPKPLKGEGHLRYEASRGRQQ